MQHTQTTISDTGAQTSTPISTSAGSIKRIRHAIEGHIRNTTQCRDRNEYEINLKEVIEVLGRREQLLLEHGAEDHISMDRLPRRLRPHRWYSTANRNIDTAGRAPEPDQPNRRGYARPVHGGQSEVVISGTTEQRGLLLALDGASHAWAGKRDSCNAERIGRRGLAQCHTKKDASGWRLNLQDGSLYACNIDIGHCRPARIV